MMTTPAIKKWIGRLLEGKGHLATYESRLVGSDTWKPNGVYFFVLTDLVHGRSPVRHMVKRMIDDGLLTWVEVDRKKDNKKEYRCLKSVLTDKAIKISCN